MVSVVSGQSVMNKNLGDNFNYENGSYYGKNATITP